MMKKIVWKFGVAALAILGWCVSAVADGVAVTSSAGAITVTVSAGTVASSAPVYLVWDTENKGDILSAWTHRAKIGEVTSTGGVFNVTGATHSIPDGAVIRVFVVDGTYDVCEYLQGDGNAYLELDYTLSSADEVTIVAMPNNSTDQSGVFGARDSASSQNFTMARTTNSKVVVDVNDKSGYSNYRLDTGWNVGAKVTFVASVARRTANGTGKTNLCPDTFTTAYSCRLFSYAGAMPSSYATAFNGRVYSFKISTLATSAVQRDLVAVNLGTDANPIPGMYDKETGATYENESPVAGAAFTLGPKTGESVGEEKTLAFSSEATYEAGEEPPPDEPIVDPSEYGTTCLTLPVGSGVNGVDSTATFATLGVSTAYTYAFSMKNPKAQTSVNKRYYGHIMGAGASNTKNGLQGNGAPLVFETNDTTGERFIEMQTWTSGGKAQCLTILGYSASNTSWSQSKSQEVEALEDGNWHNVVFTYDATAQHAQVFVDGVKLHDITSSNISQYLNWCDKTLNNEVFATPSDSGTFCIGRNSEKNDNFAGSLSNVSVWNRALSAEEAVAISGSRLAGNESGLVLYWPLDGETGDVTASDHQVNITAHDGTVYSAGTTACGTYWEEMGTTEPTVVTVTPNANQAKTVGDDDPTLTYTLSQTIAVTGTLARATGEDVGAYAINLGTLGAADPTAYTLMLAATPVYFSITNAVTPPTPPEPPTGGVEVSSSEGQITVTIAADTVASSTPVYLVWDTVADKGDAFAGWTHSAKIGDVDAAGGVFNVTGATHSILNGAAIRVFVRDGVALYSAIVKPRTVNAAIVTGYVPGVTRGTAGWDLDAKFDTSYVQVTDGNNFMGVYERFALGGSNFERFSANFGTNATDGKNVYAWPHAVNHPSAAATARYIVDENASGTQLRATRNVISARLGEYLKWGDKNTSSSTYLQKWPDQITHDFNAPVAIFGVSDWTSATSSSLMYMQIYSMTLYGARFYDKVNDELTVAADYVPAEKNGEKGLYDTMNGVFYPASAEGFTFEGAATNVLANVSVPSAAATYEAGEEPPTPVDPVVCPVIDLTGDTVRDSVVAEGTATVYQGHPTTVTTEDGRIIVVWCTPHGGHCGPAAESSDGGRTWTRIDDRFPAGYSRHVNCPSIYRLVGPDGKSRLWVWSEAKMRDTDGATDYQSCRFDATRSMPSVMSEDDGLTWQEVAPLGEKFLCTMAFTSIVRLKDGSYLGVFHTGASCGMENPRRVWQSITTDGGFTWSDPELICYAANREACEAYVFRSPDGNELCCLMRDENHNGRSMMIFSQNEGQSWTSPVDTPWGLTGDRHQGVTLPDGRLVIAFRDRALGSTTAGDFVAWVGTYEELRTCTVGDSYRLRLLRSYDGVDCGYPGIELVSAEEEMITATTYIKYWNDSRKQSVVAKRFSIAEVEGRLDRLMTATVTGATGPANGTSYSCALAMIDPADGYTALWYNGSDYTLAAAPTHTEEGVYEDSVKVTKTGYSDFYGTGVVTVTHYDPPEYGTTCLTLPVGSGVNGVDSTATFATLGVSTAYTYVFSMKNPKAQTSVNKRYYGHIMGAGASNTKNGLQGNGAPLVFETNDTTGERYIEMQTWTSGGKAQCLTILGYSASNTSWSQSKSQEVEALEDGNWHNVVFTYDATAQHAQVFVDGVKLHDITSSNLAEYLNYTDAGSAFATPSDSGTFCIGRNAATTDNFAGSLSNVSVWNRALSAEEAVAISGVRLHGNESGLVLYWPLDGETGDVTASDHQVNITAHDGTVYSAGTTTCGTYWEEMGTTEPTVVTVTPNANQAKTEGAADPVLTYTLSANIAVTGALSRAEGETVGTYAITLGTLGAVDPSAYTLELAATPVYFSITNAVTPPTPPEPGIKVGDNLTATFENGVCTISGTGAMWDKSALTELRKLAITDLIIGEGVTSIGTNVFEKLKSIREVTIGSTVTNVGQQAFYKCLALTKVTIHTGAEVPSIDSGAFARCISLVRITVDGDSSVNWAEDAFSLQAGIFMNSATGLPEIYPIPEVVDANGSVTVLYGTNDLGGDDWTKINSNADRANYHFFKIVIE